MRSFVQYSMWPWIRLKTIFASANQAGATPRRATSTDPTSIKVIFEPHYAPLWLVILPQAFAVFLWLLVDGMRWLEEHSYRDNIYLQVAVVVFAMIGAMGYESVYVGSIAWAERGSNNRYVFFTAGSSLLFSVLVAFHVYEFRGAWSLLHAGFPFVGFWYSIAMHTATTSPTTAMATGDDLQQHLRAVVAQMRKEAVDMGANIIDQLRKEALEMNAQVVDRMQREAGNLAEQLLHRVELQLRGVSENFQQQFVTPQQIQQQLEQHLQQVRGEIDEFATQLTTALERPVIEQQSVADSNKEMLRQKILKLRGENPRMGFATIGQHVGCSGEYARRLYNEASQQ